MAGQARPRYWADSPRVEIRRKTAWSSPRVPPPSNSFSEPRPPGAHARRRALNRSFLEAHCPPEAEVEFIVRLSDGRAYAQTVAAHGATPLMLMRGGYITAPAGAPLGFYRRWPPAHTPQATPSPDLTNDPLQTIATVTVAYRIAIAGNETIDSVDTTHLRLEPLRDPTAYPLRDLWIARSDGQVVRLTYLLPFKRSTALITYDFAPVGKPPVWSIVHIAASAGSETISEVLHDIAFPPDEPQSYFTPP